MSKQENTIKNMSYESLKNFITYASLIGDDISRNIIWRVVNIGTPISVHEFPIENHDSLNMLIRLYQLEELGLLNSSFEEHSNRYDRVFHATELAEKIAIFLSAPSPMIK